MMNIHVTKKTKIIIGALLAIVTVVVGVLYVLSHGTGAPLVGTKQLVVDETYGITFTYEEGPDAFTLIEPPEDQAGIQKAYVLLPTKAFNEYKESESITDAPPGINVFILRTEDADDKSTSTERVDRMTRLKEWAMKFDGLTQYSKRSAEPEEVEIDGLKALKYQADALYKQTIYLAMYKNNVYMFVSQYKDESDPTRTSFDSVLASVSFE